MAGSQSQASTLVNRGGKGGAAGAPPGAVARRRPTGQSGSSAAARQKAQAMNYYTDDNPGVKISPVVVVIVSVGFIFFVTLLHIVAKLRG